MKNSIKYILALFIIATVFVGCDKEKDKETDEGTGVLVTPTNYFMHGTNSYNLTQGILTKYGEVAPGLYNIDLEFYNSELIIHQSNNDIDSITGHGDLVYFELLTTDISILDIGVYNYNEDTIQTTNTLLSGSAVIGILPSDEHSGTDYDIASGTFTVINNSSTLELSFNCIDLDGKVIKGHYKGSVSTLDYIDAKGKKKRNF